jgi:hypothetical protein
MAVATHENTTLGANPFAGAAQFVAGSGTPGPQFGLGQTCKGNKGSEYVHVTFVAASQVTLVDGSVFTIDKDFTATLLSTTNAPRGADIGVRRVAEVLPAGTYYFWLQIKGRANVLGSASSNANLPVETTATAGQVNSPASPTVSTKSVQGMFFLTAVGGAAAASEANLLYPYIGATN